MGEISVTAGVSAGLVSVRSVLSMKPVLPLAETRASVSVYASTVTAVPTLSVPISLPDASATFAPLFRT